MRRELPDGSEAKDSYRFLDANGKEHRLADLFGRHDTLVTYFWMYGPERERPCPMCTSFVGSLDIPAIDIEQRVALAIIGRSPVSRQLEFARERGWSNLKFYQTVGDDFARDYRGLHDDGSEWAICASWKRQGDRVRLFWAAEGDFETADPGFDPHLAPDPTPLWNILDWTPRRQGYGLVSKAGVQFLSLQFFGHPFSSYTQKVLIALWADETPFEYRVLEQEHPENFEELKRHSPFALFPLIIDDGRPVFEIDDDHRASAGTSSGAEPLDSRGRRRPRRPFSRPLLRSLRDGQHANAGCRQAAARGHSRRLWC